MKKTLMSIVLCVALILVANSTGLAKLFVVEVDGMRVVVDFWVDEEQAWQYTVKGEVGWWKGLAPHPYDFKVWYPYLSDTFDMTLDEQMGWIDQLEWAGIKDWRIGYFWDTVPMKSSLFQRSLSLQAINHVYDFDSSVYFPYTFDTMFGFFGAPPDLSYVTMGRTGNEVGDPDLGGNGAIINALMGMGRPINPNYIPDGTIARSGPMFDTYYTLPRSEAQDHYLVVSKNLEVWYNDDLNYTRDDIPYTNSFGDHDGLPNPIGAWTVSDTMPQLLTRNRKFTNIRISDTVNPAVIDPETGKAQVKAGTLIPVTIVSIMQDERVGLARGFDAKVVETKRSTIVRLRSWSRYAGNGRVYHITFTEQDNPTNVYTLKIGVPVWRGSKTSILVDDGPLFDSTGE